MVDLSKVRDVPERRSVLLGACGAGTGGLQNNIKPLHTIGLAAALAAANPVVYRGLIFFCTHCFLG